VAGLGKQGRRKAAKRAADLSIKPATDGRPSYWRPPPEECLDLPQNTFAPPDGSLTRDRIVVRMNMHAATDQIVEFAVIQQTKHRGTWQTVCVADSCHDDEAHLHRHAWSTGERVGEPEQLLEIHTLKDVGYGYDLAYAAVIDNWTTNRGRWLDA
jgi:hypothetical protein